jgi:hypothetical protein
MVVDRDETVRWLIPGRPCASCRRGIVKLLHSSPSGGGRSPPHELADRCVDEPRQ